MQLKKLEMCGFKSFAQKTEILFEPGVTCIVGPNGCGKSNVVDAIKWVLGTLSHKSVRGEEMLDVIFKGADGAGPAGMAEVSLTLDNADHALPVDFAEVTITRRLYRSGEGEYLINRTACRLKDIRDLLYGTGIGADNYSIIEQGKIDRLVTSDPKSRRLVFDEAAGISKYRARKKETENRLEKVTQDLLRVNDVVREVQRELRSVRGQAGRAARYREMTNEYRVKRTLVLVHDYRSLRGEGAELEARIAGLEAAQAERGAALGARREELARLEREVRELSDRSSALASERSAAASRAEFYDRALAAAERRVAELAEARELARRERDSASALLAEQRGHLGAAEAERERALAELGAIDAKVAELGGWLEEAQRSCRETAADLEARKAEAVALAQQESRARNELSQAKSDRDAAEARRARVEEQAAAAAAELEALRPEVEAARARKAEFEEAVARLKRAVAAGEEEQAALQVETARLDGELMQLRAARDRSESRRETLRELESAFEGLGQGARRLLKANLPGLCGTVADLLEAPAEHVAAVEAVLGEQAGTVVFETSEHVRLALEFLREHRLPRTSVLSLDRLRAPLRPHGTLPRVSSLVTAGERYRALAEALLGDAILAPTESAADILASLPHAITTVVARSGDVFDANGSVWTGRRTGGLVSRKTELKTLESEIAQFQDAIARLESERKAAGDRAAELERRLREQRHEVYDQGMALSDTLKTLELREQRMERIESDRGHLVAELGQAAARIVELDARRGELEARIASIEQSLEGAERSAASLAEALKLSEAAREDLRARHGALQVERATAEEQRISASRRVDMVAAEIARHEETARRQEESLAQIDSRSAAAGAELETQRAEQAAAAGVIAEKQAAAEAAAAERDAAQARLESGRDGAAELQRGLDEGGRDLQEARVRQAQRSAALENLAARAREELELDLAAEAAPAAEAPEADGGEAAFAVEEELAAELLAPAAPAEPETDWTALARETEELRAKIAGFGAVNVVALEQLDGLEAREKDLLAQQDDVEKAKRQLEELIRRIDRESKILFERTLEYVREQFGTIFRKVFGGGKADIVLQQEEGVDPLDQGLEVMARIPQRELMPISSLSGGQKTLTAFSLVMALFRANPSPFCVLDEADAALDEANVDKYAGMVNEFVGETQFIVISHNKRTMAAADVLYGVTMETPGISKKVSVDLHGEGGMESLRKRRDELMAARAESAGRKAAEMSRVREAATAALAAEEQGEPVPAAAPAPAPELPEVLDATKLLDPYNYSAPPPEPPAAT